MGALNLGPFANRPFISVAAAGQMLKARALLEGNDGRQVEADAMA